MIVPMKKTTLLMQAKDAGHCLRDLRRLGVLHVEHQNLPQDKDIAILQEEAALINSSIDVLKQAGALEKYPKEQTISSDWKAAAKHLMDLWKRYDQLESYSRNIIHQIAEWEPWGDFDPLEIKNLAQKGIYIKFYQVPVKQINEFPDEVVVKNIFTRAGLSYCAAISHKPFECAFKEVPLPKQGLSTLKKRLIEDRQAAEAIKFEIFKSASFYENFLAIKKKLQKDIEFQQVLSGMGKDGTIVYVTGYIPFDSQAQLIAEAKNRKWAIVISEPLEDDNVPTLVRNPKWVNMIKPVLGLLGITPGYHELDVSTLFLVFFSVFFGILIGDAGYGLVYMLLTIWMQKKMRGKIGMKNTIPLFYILSSCAILWGILTGTFFGQEWLLRLGARPLLPKLNDPKFMQTFCFFLGALHLSIAHSWRASLKFPALEALADVGWICVLWGAFFLARTLILGEVFPAWGKGLIIAGVALAVLFSHPQANILKAIAKGLGTVALSLMNNFTDVVSYVRLFAVGLAAVAIAETTNVMASGLGNSVPALLASIMIVIVGHGLNIVLGPIAVLVHGVRLNVLEFSGHANVTWSGLVYEPLKE